MGWLQILKMVPLILSIINGVEALITGRKTGAVKKRSVLKGTDGILEGLASAGIIKAGEAEEAKGAMGEVVDEIVSVQKESGYFGAKEASAEEQGAAAAVGRVMGEKELKRLEDSAGAPREAPEAPSKFGSK